MSIKCHETWIKQNACFSLEFFAISNIKLIHWCKVKIQKVPFPVVKISPAFNEITISPSTNHINAYVTIWCHSFTPFFEFSWIIFTYNTYSLSFTRATMRYCWQRINSMLLLWTSFSVISSNYMHSISKCSNLSIVQLLFTVIWCNFMLSWNLWK